MGMLWVVAPKILTDNSTEKNLQRNNSIWWCIYIFSMVIGMFHRLCGVSTLIEVHHFAQLLQGTMLISAAGSQET